MLVSSPTHLNRGVSLAAATFCRCHLNWVTFFSKVQQKNVDSIPCTEHIAEIIKLANVDESIVSQERFGALRVRRNGVANLHADCIGLRRVRNMLGKDRGCQ